MTTKFQKKGYNGKIFKLKDSEFRGSNAKVVKELSLQCGSRALELFG
jgi:hypothetical protein